MPEGISMDSAEAAAWARLGRRLVQCRSRLDPRYKNRRLFAAERGLDYRLAADIEKARRQNFEASTLAAVEAAYGLDPGDVNRILRGDSLESRVAAPRTDEGEPGEVVVLVLDPDDAVERAIWAQDKPEAVRAREIQAWRRVQGKAASPPDRRDTG